MHPDTLKRINQMIDYIKQFQMDTGCSPSYDEICAAIGVTNSYITRLMRLAECRGLLRKPYGTRREIELV